MATSQRRRIAEPVAGHSELQFDQRARSNRRHGARTHECSAEDALDLGRRPAAGNFARSEFSVAVSNWTVSGSNRDYQVAGPGSWRVEDDDVSIRYTGQWTTDIGNYSGGSIGYATTPGASVSYPTNRRKTTC
jgi:hypothetical protein